ncbi:hypothetical protein [Streptomyces bacillaris]|uniref:hypothetical protein n=1 Tax=Streptomyces bacillaris TaxID=68179 RepID=UPI0034615A56
MTDTTPTPADRPAVLLRAAAEKLREEAARARRALPAPWTVTDEHVVRCADGMIVADRSCTDHPAERADLLYIALMHPGAGLALAAWLDVAADHARQGFMCCDDGPDRCSEVVTPALAVARQLLGTTEGEGVRCVCGETACESENCDCDSRTCPVDHAAEETDEEREQREDREEAARLHAAGDHQYCDVTCETAMPTEAMRNFVIAKGYPGTAGALDELLRRAAAPPAPADRAAHYREAANGLAAIGPLNNLVSAPAAWNEAIETLRRMADQIADDAAAGVQPPTSEAEPEPEPLTEEQVIRQHVTTVHLIGDQLADVESWLWQRLADARDTTPPAAPAAPEEPQ